MNTTIESSKSLSLRSDDHVKAASIFDTFSPAATTPTMENPTSPPSLVPPTTTYRDYLSRTETYTFRRCRCRCRCCCHARKFCKADICCSKGGHPLRLTTVAPGDEGEGRVDSAPPFGVELRTKDGAAGVHVGQPLLHS